MLKYKCTSPIYRDIYEHPRSGHNFKLGSFADDPDEHRRRVQSSVLSGFVANALRAWNSELFRTRKWVGKRVIEHLAAHFKYQWAVYGMASTATMAWAMMISGFAAAIALMSGIEAPYGRQEAHAA